MLATVAYTNAAIGGMLILGLLIAGFVFWVTLAYEVSQKGMPAPKYLEWLRQRHWSGRDLLHVGIWVSVFLLFFFVMGSWARHAGLDPHWLHVIAALQNSVLQLLVGGLLVVRMRGCCRDLRDGFGPRDEERVQWTHVVPLIVKCYVLALPAVFSAAWISQFLIRQSDAEHSFQPVLVFFTDAATPDWFRWWLVGVAVLLAPIVEEALFRGVMLPVLLRKYGLWTSLMGCSVLFALVHGHLPSMLPLTVLGFGLGAAYIYTGNLLVPIGMHALFNGVNLLVLLLAGGLPGPM